MYKMEYMHGAQDVSSVERQLGSLHLNYGKVLLESAEARRARRSVLQEEPELRRAVLAILDDLDRTPCAAAAAAVICPVSVPGRRPRPPAAIAYHL